MSTSTRRVRIQWTTTAKECLKKLPPKVQRGLIDKADELCACTDPARAHKPLVGPLANYNRITCGRFRAVYRVDEDHIASGDVLVTITITFVAAGKRAEHSKGDVYKVAQKLVEMGLIDVANDEPPPPKPLPKPDRSRSKRHT